MASTPSHPQLPTSAAGTMSRDRRVGWQGAGGVVAFVLALAASVLLLFLPLYATMTTTSTGATTQGRASLWAENGPWILIPLAVPVLLTAVIALARGRGGLVVSILCTFVLAAFTVLALASIGMFYLPALIVAAVAVLGRAVAGSARR